MAEKEVVATSELSHHDRFVFISKMDKETDVLKVGDEEILSASVALSKNTGIFSEPAAATSFAGFLRYFKDNKLDENSQNVVLLTGSGLKDLKSVQSLLQMPKAIKPDIEAVKNIKL